MQHVSRHRPSWNKFYFCFYRLIFCSPVLGKVSHQRFPLGVWRALVRSRNQWLTCPSWSLSFLKIISSSCGGENPSQDRSQDNCSWKLSLQGIGMGFCGMIFAIQGIRPVMCCLHPRWDAVSGCVDAPLLLPVLFFDSLRELIFLCFAADEI